MAPCLKLTVLPIPNGRNDATHAAIESGNRDKNETVFRSGRTGTSRMIPAERHKPVPGDQDAG